MFIVDYSIFVKRKQVSFFILWIDIWWLNLFHSPVLDYFEIKLMIWVCTFHLTCFLIANYMGICCVTECFLNKYIHVSFKTQRQDCNFVEGLGVTSAFITLCIFFKGLRCPLFKAKTVHELGSYRVLESVKHFSLGILGKNYFYRALEAAVWNGEWLCCLLYFI